MKHVLGFSGGADSQAVARLLLDEHGPEDVILLYSDPGSHDHPLTYAWIANYSATVHPVITVTPIVADMGNRSPGAIAALGLSPNDPLTFELLARLKGRFPGSKMRFCTEHLKLLPQRRWHMENEHGLLASGFERYNGVRRDESERRANAADREWDTFFDCYMNRPIAGWTKGQVFDFLARCGEDPNPLYKMGAGRVGCSPCINASKGDIREWAARFPDEVERVRRMEAVVGRSFFPPILPGKRYGMIDEVIEWSKTEHGGKQFSLPFVETAAETGSCSSRYGLCE